MAYRTVTIAEIIEVLQLWLGGEAKRRIARKTGIARRTVRRYVDIASACGLSTEEGRKGLTDERIAHLLAQLKDRSTRSRGGTWDQCEQQRSFIKEHVEGKAPLTVVREMLQLKGVEVPYSTLYRFVVENFSAGGSVDQATLGGHIELGRTRTDDVGLAVVESRMGSYDVLTPIQTYHARRTVRRRDRHRDTGTPELRDSNDKHQEGVPPPDPIPRRARR